MDIQDKQCPSHGLNTGHYQYKSKFLPWEPIFICDVMMNY